MERGTLSLSPDPILATHEFRCFEEQGKRRSRQGSIMTPEKSRDGIVRTKYPPGGLAVWQFRLAAGETTRISLRFKFNWHGKVFPANEVSHYDQPLLSNRLPIIEGCYVSENEIARYSRAGVAGGARRCPRDSTRPKGDEKSCEGCFGAIWNSNVSNLRPYTWKWIAS